MADFIEKLLIFTVGFVLWVSGVLLIVFGSIALASPDTIISLLNLIDGVSYVTSIFDVMPLFEGVAIFMIVLGSFLFVVGAVGGGVLRMKKVRFGYIAGMTCAILTEIALIIYACVYPGTTKDWIQEQMKGTLPSFESVQIKNSTGDIMYADVTTDTVAYGWQHLQFQTQCCGVLSPMDFKGYSQWERNYTVYGAVYNVTFPPSCCTVQSTFVGQAPTNVKQLTDYAACFRATEMDARYISDQTCTDVVMRMLWEFNYISIIIASCLIATELIGIALTAHYVSKDRYV
jgi:hypothetical protein